MHIIRLAFLGMLFFGATSVVHAQLAPPGDQLQSTYDASEAHPFGRLNPQAPSGTGQYDFMIGNFECTLSYKAYQNNEWVVVKEGKATWNARYVMNGQAVLDEFRDEWGDMNVDVRVYDADAEVWRIHYTSANPAQGELFEARQVQGRMVMESERETPGGFKYLERIAFEPLSDRAYRWTKEVVYSATASVITDEIHCQRR
ncbi:MAG: hypothetical protein RhofKO_14380 [Rhodothermales bacterium]